MRQYREPVDVCVNYIDSLLVLAEEDPQKEGARLQKENVYK